MLVLRQACPLIAAVLLTISAAKADVALLSGWNLVGNGSANQVNVETTFNDANQFLTVWKWNAVAGNWSFYSPSLSSAELSTYAQKKGYEVLTTIQSKEGFWVNAKNPTRMKINSLGNVSPLMQSDLSMGWNLLATAEMKTPSQLNASLINDLDANGKSIVTTWAWDASTSNWRFYAPALERQGGTVLVNYIASKNYLTFTAPLNQADGFWMNIAPSTPKNSNTAPNHAMPVVAIIAAGI